MSSLLGAAAGFRPAEWDESPCSVAPGRRCRDVEPVPERTRTAVVPAAVPRRVPGTPEARTALLTDGVLVGHDASAGVWNENVLDEATSAVDDGTGPQAVGRRTLRVLAADRTTPVTAPRLSTVRHADRIHVIDEGGVVAEQGTHDEVLARQGLHASLRRLQAGEPAA
ncbi:hypothetical protein [Streptomyces triticiradicis]|uniref:hypothetical protein n=1 Tax=Streptomyces triticiradicis TaxID=2651189 RepID=UPI001788C3B2|nr:hypothetical protein [Streptomyces triticiradicis]